jgi:hypothetical protein
VLSVEGRGVLGMGCGCGGVRVKNYSNLLEFGRIYSNFEEAGFLISFLVLTGANEC